jgi:hypothetical protein
MNPIHHIPKPYFLRSILILSSRLRLGLRSGLFRNLGCLQSRELCSEKKSDTSWKLSTTEERRQDQSCLFRTGNYRNNGHSQPRETVLSSIRSEGGFCRSETKHDRWTAPIQSCLFRWGDLRNKGHDTGKLSWVRVLTMFSVARELSTIEEWSHGRICSFRRGDLIR